MATHAYATDDLEDATEKSVNATDPEDLTGAVLAGRYRLRRLLDRGGMGYVYYGEHTAIGKRVAVKVMTSEVANSDHRKRLLREAQACSRLAHENVIDITDFGQAPNGSVFLVMELLQGETLASTLDREGPLPWARAKSIILQICRALHAAHNLGILHRDVKPDNCFRIKRGANRDFIKMFDFGLAKIMRDGNERPLTSSGTIFGTPEYMSPEQTRGEPVDHRSDLYSAGIILYELVTGIVPFRGEHFMEIFKQQVAAAPKPPSELNPAISPALERVILKAIAKDPKQRYQSMQELATALTAVPTKRAAMDNTRAGLAIIAGGSDEHTRPSASDVNPAASASLSTISSTSDIRASAAKPVERYTEPVVPQQAMRDLIHAMNSRERVYLFIIAILGLSLVLLASAIVSH